MTKITEAQEAAEAKLARVRDMHGKKKHWDSDRSYMFVCEECTRINRYGVVLYPCPTIEAIGESAALGGDAA